MTDTENTGNENARPAESAGHLIRDARLRAGISGSKLCADLRISASTLDALESGDYDKLAGAPYTRAMLVSLSRYLRLDARTVLEAYAAETGTQPPPAQTRTIRYKDESPGQARTHRQIFLLLLVVVLFVLVLIMGRIGTDSEAGPHDDASPAAVIPAPSDLMDTVPAEPVPADSLASDSAARADSAARGVSAADSAALAAQEEPEEEEDLPRETRVRIQGVSDSVWLRVLPAGRGEVSQYLRSKRASEFVHTDAITFITRSANSVRVFIGDSSVVPSRRRFKVDGDQISY